MYKNSKISREFINKILKNINLEVNISIINKFNLFKKFEFLFDLYKLEKADYNVKEMVNKNKYDIL